MERYILILIKAYDKGFYEKSQEGYIFQLGASKKCIVSLTDQVIEFNIGTIKWLPGSYEPVEGNELYKRVSYMELETLRDEDISIMFKNIIEKVIN